MIEIYKGVRVGMDILAAKSALLKVKKIFDTLNIKFWPQYGTLLGMIRNQDFISGDTDIDLVMLASDWTPRIRTYLLIAGFYHTHMERKWGIPLQIRPIKNEVRVDISIMHYYPPKDLYVRISKRMRDKWNCISAIHFQGDYFIDFLGHKLRVCNQSEILLENWYGPDWRIPTPHMSSTQHKSATRKNSRRGKGIKIPERNKYLDWIHNHKEWTNDSI